MPHSYSVTVQPHDGRSALSFDVTNHDDILELVKRVGAGGAVPDDEVAALMVGLKLFGEVVLHHRADPLFVELFPHFVQFMKRLKTTVARSTGA